MPLLKNDVVGVASHKWRSVIRRIDDALLELKPEFRGVEDEQ